LRESAPAAQPATRAILEKQITAASLYPLKKGNTWTYAAQSGSITADAVFTVTDVRNKDEETLVTLEGSTQGKRTLLETLSVTPTEVLCVATGADGKSKFEPPLPILRYPAQPGEQWEWAGIVTQKDKEYAAQATITIRGRETVTTPAGTFNAVSVTIYLVIDHEEVQIANPMKLWFAENVGIVRSETEMGIVGGIDHRVNRPPVEMILSRYTVN
jgi:hypothetical protein